MNVRRARMSEQRDDEQFKVVIYANEYRQICAWVLQHGYLETGGDLFGLWKDDNTAVVQLVLGPGKNCQRASASFYQDVDYLEKAGSQLIKKEGVCHIGEWHSHHKIGLKQPSGGDKGTVWRNMPKYGLNRFVLFIANIEMQVNSAASVGCFLFERGTADQSQRVTQGQFHLLPQESPLREKFQKDLKEGSETINEKEEISRISLFTADQSVEASQLATRPIMCRTGRPVSQLEGELATANENMTANKSVRYRLKRRCPLSCTTL